MLGGEYENDLKEVICSLDQEVIFTGNKPFKSLLNVKFHLNKEYTSFTFFDSDDMADIPYDEDYSLICEKW